MSQTARSLYRYRALLATLTRRDLTARYRGSVFGWLWSLVNPLVLLTVYTFVFTLIFKAKDPSAEPYALFLITGIFPWTWMQSSWLEGTSSLLANAGLIRKATFPSELLPIVPVLSNLVHFGLSLPVIAIAIIAARYMDFPVGGPAVLLLPVLVLFHLPLVAGGTLALAALNAHFKDVKDLISNLLTLLFFMTPILYTLNMIAGEPWVARVVSSNPLTPYLRAYQDVLFYGRVPAGHLWLHMAVVSTVAWLVGTMVYDRLRDTLVEAV